MRFRIGVNLGDVMYDGTRVYGDGLNVAARVQELAEPGGICVTAMVREEVGARTSLAFKDLGAQHLKNIPRPVRVFRVRLDDQGEPRATPHVAGRGVTRAWRRPVLIGVLAVALAGVLGLGVRLTRRARAAGGPAPPVHCSATLQQPEWRPGTGLLQRRPYRGPDHRPVAY